MCKTSPVGYEGDRRVLTALHRARRLLGLLLLLLGPMVCTPADLLCTLERLPQQEEDEDDADGEAEVRLALAPRHGRGRPHAPESREPAPWRAVRPDLAAFAPRVGRHDRPHPRSSVRLLI